jgi:hypothetical protein
MEIMGDRKGFAVSKSVKESLFEKVTFEQRFELRTK